LKKKKFQSLKSNLELKGISNQKQKSLKIKKKQTTNKKEKVVYQRLVAPNKEQKTKTKNLLRVQPKDIEGKFLLCNSDTSL
jgi:hypothetical protein